MKIAKSKTATVQTKSSGPFFRKENRTDSSCVNGNEPSFFSRKPVSHTGVQAKLNIGEPGDRYEKEADAVADKTVQRLSDPGESITEKAPAIQRRSFINKSPTPKVQRECAPCIPEPTKGKGDEKEKDKEPPKGDRPVRRKPIFDSNAEPPDDDKTVQRKCAECEKEQKKDKQERDIIQRKCAKCEAEEKEEHKHDDEKHVQRKPIFESNAEKEEGANVQRKCAACEKEEQLQKKEGNDIAEKDTSAIEAGLSASKGAGSPLPEGTRQQMESSIGADFSKVRVHNDSSAVQMSKDINAQAFTHGNDIYFNAGKYDTSSKEGQHLLAHELTHTVQQSGEDGSLQQLVQRDTPKSSSGSTNAKKKLREATKAELDGAKDDSIGSIEKKGKQLIFHIAVLESKKYSIPQTVVDEFSPKKNTPIPKGEERETDQGTIWKSAIREKAREKLEKIAEVPAGATIDPKKIMRLKTLKAKRAYQGIVGTIAQLTNEVLVPSWDYNGNPTIYQIEHMIDWQLIGMECDKIKNLILLEEKTNNAAGKTVKKAIPDALKKIATLYAKTFDDVPLDGNQIKKKYDVVIDKISGAGKELNKKDHYKPDSLQKGDDDYNPYKETNISLKEEKIPEGYFLLTSSSGRASYLIPFTAKDKKIGAFKVTVEKKGDDVESVTLKPIVGGKDKEIGVKGPLESKQVTIAKQEKDKYIIGNEEERNAIAPSLKSLSLTKFSPIQIDDKDIVIDGLDVSVKGKVKSTLSILDGVDISFSYENGEFNVAALIPMDQIGKNIPKPFKIDYCNIEIGGGTNTPLYIAGGLGFSIEKFGEGEIFAKLDATGVSFEGRFNFDSKWFDPAEICISYEKGEWRITGKIGIKKGVLKGVKSATICVGYMNHVFTVSGDAELDVPGIDKIKLGASIAENGDMNFFADVELKKLPGIKGGSVHVSIMSKADGELKVSVTGEAIPDFPNVPGLAAKLAILYDDGIFDVRATANYQKGKFEGSIEIGITNRKVDEKGQPQGDPDEKNSLSVFGYGKLTVTLFKDIKGSVSIRLTPEKEVLIAGEIVVQNLSPFGDGYSFDKELITFPQISIPLIGIPGMSVSAFIDGAVHFKFNWQPLILKELRVGFDETNINELDRINLNITGSIGSSAHAEVYLQINAGLKAQVLIAALEGSLGGQAGLGIDAEAGGKIDASWNMDKGLQFKEIRAYLDVTPKAMFRLVGGVKVILDLWVTSITLYEHEWVLAEKQIDLGGIGLKVDFPIKFSDEGNVQMPDPDKMNLQKPDFSGDQGKKILDSAINGDAEKEMEQKKQEIRAKIRYDLRNSTNDDDFTPSKYREKMMDKYEKSPELQEYVSHTIDEESRILEYEHFEEEKNLIRNANIALPSKLNMLNIFMMFHQYITPVDIEVFKQELIMLDELRKIKEAEAAAAAQQPPPPPKDDQPPKKLPDVSQAPKAANKQAAQAGRGDKGSARNRQATPGRNDDRNKVQRKEMGARPMTFDKEEQTEQTGNISVTDAPVAKQDTDQQKGNEGAQPVVKPASVASGTIQRDPADDLDASFKKAMDEKDWKKAAEYLNGFNREDILTRLHDKSTGIVAAIHSGALENPAVGPKAQVADLTRWAYLEMNFRNELKKKQWKDAAMFLNGFNDMDIKKYLGTITIDEKVNLRNAAIPNGFPAVVKNIDADIEFQSFEKARIAKLEDDYNTAIAKKDWKNAATLLNAYNDEDIQVKLSLLNITSPESVKLIRSAADNMEENSRVGRFAQAIILGSSTYLKDLALAGPLIGDVWTMQFVKGMEISGVAGRFGESWNKVKENFSDPKNGASFIGGIYSGYFIGVVKDVWENIKGIVELAWDLVKLQVEATFEPDKLANEIIRIVKALPELVLKLMNGEEIGYQVGLYLSRNINSEFIQKSPFDQGIFVGNIVGRVTTEIALLFVGVEEVSAIAKSLRATKWGVAVAEALEASKAGKALMEARAAGKALKGTEELVLDAGKMENALLKMARIEEKAPAITEDMMKIEQHLMSEQVSKSSDLIKPSKEAGFDAEITVGEHTYKRTEVEGTWCRFTTKTPKCDISLPAEVEKAADDKVPPAVRLAYKGEKAKDVIRISNDTFEKARSMRMGMGLEEEAMKKNVAVIKVVTDDKEVFLLEAANQGGGGAHSEEMLVGQLDDLNNQLRKLSKKGRVVELFSERVPCSNCRGVIQRYFGTIDVFYMVGSSEPERWKEILKKWQSIEKALAATKK